MRLVHKRGVGPRERASERLLCCGTVFMGMLAPVEGIKPRPSPGGGRGEAQAAISHPGVRFYPHWLRLQPADYPLPRPLPRSLPRDRRDQLHERVIDFALHPSMDAGIRLVRGRRGTHMCLSNSGRILLGRARRARRQPRGDVGEVAREPRGLAADSLQRHLRFFFYNVGEVVHRS